MRETLKNLKRVYNYARDYRKNFIIFSIMSVILIVFNIINPILSAKIIVALSENLYVDLLMIALVVTIIYIIVELVVFVMRKNTQVFFRGTAKNIEVDAANSILKIELSNIDKKNSGTFIQRLTSDPNEMGHIYTRGMHFLVNILTSIGIFIAVFFINKLAFLYYLISFIIVTILMTLRAKKMNEKDKKWRKQKEKTTS